MTGSSRWLRLLALSALAGAATAPLSGSYVMSLPTQLATDARCLRLVDRPDGSYLLLWRDVDEGGLRMRPLGPRGEPLGPPEPFPVVGPFIDCHWQLAIAPDGQAAFLWGEPPTVPHHRNIRGALLDAGLHPVGDLPVGLDGTGHLLQGSNGEQVRVTPHPDGGFLLAWSEHTPGDYLWDIDDSFPGYPDLPAGYLTGDVFLRRVDAAGAPVGEPVRINQDRDVQLPQGLVTTPAGTVVITWDGFFGQAASSHIRARVLALDLSPISPEIEATIPLDLCCGPQWFSAPPAVASDGSFVLAWTAWGRDGIDPQLAPSYAVVAYWYDPQGEPVSDQQIVNQTTPGAQVGGVPAVASDHTTWVLWSDGGLPPPRPEPHEPWRLMVRRLAWGGAPAAPEAEVAPAHQERALRPLPPDPAAPVAEDAGVLALWSHDGAIWARTIEPSELAPPPGVPALTTAAIPGFRFWVRITAQSGEGRWGAAEPCIAEALCASGAIPGRPEVLVRVIGPRPNGYLWPTLTKLTTSQVEVWIEQTSTRAVRYYLLEGAAPGFEELPGLFDRTGFTP
jgi:hypothetical protein